MSGNVAVGFAGMCAIIFFLYGPWQATCTDLARQYCFAKRDALFDMAASGKISFKSQEYKSMRSSLERTIRYCHEMSIFKLAMFGFDSSSTRKNDDHLSTLSRAASNVKDDKIRKELEDLACHVELYIVFIIFIRSPLLCIISPVVLAAILTYLVFDLTRERFIGLIRGVGERVQIQAEGA